MGKCEEVSNLTTNMDSLDLNSKEGKNLLLAVLKQQGETIKAMAQERTMMMDQMKSTIIGNNNNNNYININMFLIKNVQMLCLFKTLLRNYKLH